VGKCEVNHGQEGDGELEGWKMRNVVLCKGQCYKMLHDLADIVQTVFIALCNYETD